ncbi:hypothetical protein NPIL_86021 [Nephila pilipes]|uniref:Uncharacterized protein n=1 Tax=Nephila pilipes TaxID=299642 RepID=A0A8X6NVI2_NEPPI|nr:hypothetical protein NPIL_86021 [Nephila pilipes]
MAGWLANGDTCCPYCCCWRHNVIDMVTEENIHGSDTHIAATAGHCYYRLTHAATRHVTTPRRKRPPLQHLLESFKYQEV